MNLIYQRDISYYSETKTLKHNVTGQEYSNFVGVSKLCNYGERTLLEKLEKRYGEEKAKNICKNSVERGNNIHKKLEINTIYVPEVKGFCFAREVFLFGNILGQNVTGTIDAIYDRENLGFDILEYKTKSGRKSWEKYKSQNLSKYYKQLYAYSVLAQQMYGIKINNLKLVIIFSDETPNQVYTMSKLDYKFAKRGFNSKVVEYISDQNSGI